MKVGDKVILNSHAKKTLWDNPFINKSLFGKKLVVKSVGHFSAKCVEVTDGQINQIFHPSYLDICKSWTINYTSNR